MQRFVFRLTMIVALVALTVLPVTAQPSDRETAGTVQRPIDPTDVQNAEVMRQVDTAYGLTAAQIEKVYGGRGEELVNIIVQLTEPDVVNYAGGINGLAASAPTGGQRFSAEAPAAQAYINFLNNRHAQFAGEVAQVSAAAKPIATYVAALNGVALTLPASDVLKVSQMPGVQAVFQDAIVKPDTDRGPQWIEAPSVWSALGGQEVAGEDVVAGIIDGGSWSPNQASGLLTYTDTLPSYADDASVVGGAYAFPFTSVTGENYTDHLGVCATVSPLASDGTFDCNNKLIGGYFYRAGTADLPVELNSPIDQDGHGTHTSTTVAGNVVTVTAGSTQLPISGVAPRARIIAYKACWNEDPDDPDDGGCAFVDTTSAINQAILDGVNVINYSIGGGDTLGGDAPELAFLQARAAGIFVATSAGNDGPDESTVGHLSPWLTTSAAMDHDRDFRATVELTSTFTVSMPTDLEGASATGGYTGQIILAPLQGAETVLPSLCNEPYAPGTFSGEIVVCRRGIDPRVEKGKNVLDGGAGGYVLVNAAPNQGLALDPHWLPAVHLEFNATAFSEAGESLVTYLAAAATATQVVTATLSGGAPAVRAGDVMAAFSSRGPTGINLIKPDVAAPGSAIFAGTSPQQYENYNPDGSLYQFQNGTSMASPHVAGSGALLVALHTDWTPAEIQSALMTGGVAILKEDGTTQADPFDQGSGRVDLSHSMDPGLVFDIPISDYNAVVANTKPVETLNYPSMANASCLGTCSWVRSGQNVMGSASTYTWTVEAATPGLTVTLDALSYSVAMSATQSFTVTADVTALPAGAYAYARVVLVENASGREVVLPVAVVPTFGTLPGAVAFEVRRDAGSIPVENLTAIEITDLTVQTYGLTEATLTTQSSIQDPTNGNPYDNIGTGSFYVTTTVPSGAVRLVAEITETESDDIDMWVGLDADNDGPELSEEVLAIETSAALEYANINDPAPGVYWVLVMNWDASATPPDATTVAVAAVPGSDEGNLDVTGPGAVNALDPFELRIFWDDDDMDEGDRYYGAFDVGPNSSQPGIIGTVLVDIVRIEDDVVKTATAANASPGDTLTYTITINPNVLPEDLTYMLTDTIPAGMTYVPGSATNGAVVVGDTLTWTDTMEAPPENTYLMSTSVSDPDNCAVPLANQGAYLDAKALNSALNPNFAVVGDTVAFNTFTTGAGFEFWGVTGAAGSGLTFTDDGFVRFGSSSGTAPWVHQDIPSTDVPNNMAAILWRDMEIITATAPISRGVTLVTLGGTGAGGGVLIEYDDIQLYQVPGNTLDMEMFMWRSSGDGPEIIFAYDNISSPIITGTVGLENVDGTEGVKYAFDDAPLGNIVDGFAICFDWSQPAHDAEVITYAVTVDNDVDAPATLTNDVDHTVNNPGSKLATTSLDVIVAEYVFWFPLFRR